MSDQTPSQLSVLEQLQAVHAGALSYFDNIARVLPDAENEYDLNPYPFGPGYWEKLSIQFQGEAVSIAARLAALAQLTAATIRRSPLLTEADEREAGHAFKGMRAALRLRSFEFEEVEVLHDEGTVLGVQPARESERNTSPKGARADFDKWLAPFKADWSLQTYDQLTAETFPQLEQSRLQQDIDLIPLSL